MIGEIIGGATSAIGTVAQHALNLDTMNVQNQYNEEMQRRQQAYNKEMWNYTNYENQRQHMEAAGLNPALMYGMGGGGGTSTNGGQGQGVSAVGGNEVSAGAQMGIIGLQMQSLESQIELNKANAKKAEADANKTAGVDTEQTRAITELTKNQNLTETQKRELIKVQEDLTWSEKALKDQKATTEVMNQRQLYHETELYKQKVIEAGKTIDGLTLDNEIKKASKEALIQESYAKVSEIYSRQMLMQKQGNVQDAEVSNIGNLIKTRTRQIMQGDESIEQAWKQVEVAIGHLNNENKRIVQDWFKVATGIAQVGVSAMK